MQSYPCSGLMNNEQTASQQMGWFSYVSKQAKSATASLHSEVERAQRTTLQSNRGATSQPTTSGLQQPASSRPRIATLVDDRRSDFTPSMLQKHQEITELLIQQQKSQHLPPREIAVFEGDSLQFSLFTKAFKHCVEEKTNNKGDCLYFLERYTRGRQREIV